MPAAIDPDRILDAALAVWREEGFRAATTRKVAARAGVGEMTLFRRYGDKGKLMAAVMAREAERFAPEAMTPTEDVAADLRAIVAGYAELLDRLGSVVFDFLLHAPTDPALAAVRPVPLAAVGRAAQVIAAHQAAGRLQGSDPMAAVLALLGPSLAGALVGRAQPGAIPPFDPVDMVDRFLDGWKTQAR
ncbi:TetR/AcrR family transcriptional regulator [Histidinibacterium lentulum]|nr:TetR/AcrR family transcriptional regulator [Histidinibacterium lentulum]